MEFLDDFPRSGVQRLAHQALDARQRHGHGQEHQHQGGCGNRLTPSAWIRPISSAEDAPPMLPRPPVARPPRRSRRSRSRPSPGWPGSRGSCNAPPSPAKAQPGTTAPSIRGRDDASASSMARGPWWRRAGADQNACGSRNPNSSHTSGPSIIVTSCQTGKNSPHSSTAPLSPRESRREDFAGPEAPAHGIAHRQRRKRGHQLVQLGHPYQPAKQDKLGQQLLAMRVFCVCVYLAQRVHVKE